MNNPFWNRIVFQLRMRWKALRFRISPNMITCKEFDAFIVDYLDNSLPQTQRERFELHMEDCRACAEYLEAYKRSAELSKQLLASPDEGLPEDVPADLIAAVVDAQNLTRNNQSD